MDVGSEVYLKKDKGIKTITSSNWGNFKAEDSTVTYSWSSVDYRATKYRNGILDIINQIESEIDSSSNIGKKGCIRRLNELLDKMEDE